MTNSKLIFKKNINNQGIPITNCFFDDDPENILATMVEDVPENFQEPLYLQKSIVVSVPYNDDSTRIEISIWFSPNESNEKMSEVIQSYFDWRFKNLKDKNTFLNYHPIVVSKSLIFYNVKKDSKKQINFF